MKYILIFSILLVAAKCGDKGMEGVTQLKMGEEATIAVGESLHVAGSKTDGFRFVSVEQDSRCPKGVNCVQAGKATIVVEEMNGSPRQVSVPADARKNPTFMIKGGQIEILGLDPYPVSGTRTPFGEYELRVKLTPGGAKM